MTSIIIGGDLVPTKSNFELFSTANTTVLFGDALLNILNQADFRVFNLEVPLTDKEEPINKCGPNLIAPTGVIKGIKRIQADLLSLANNHILDQGEQGLYSTTKVLEENGINYVGAGSNLCVAAQPHIFESRGISIGFYACAEHEFTIATEKCAGANPFDPLESLDHIRGLKEQNDYVIVLYHGGKEHYRYPSPNLQRVCRRIIDKGADLVVCQHSHCVGTYEAYKESTIVYGQGNFLFDNSENEFWQTSLLLDVKITKSKLTVEYIPIVKYGNSVRLASEYKSKEIMKGFLKRSRQIQKEGFIQQEYEKFAAKMLKRYLAALHGNNLFFRVLNKLSGHNLVAKLYSDRSLIAMQNYIECEAHRELILTGLKSHLK